MISWLVSIVYDKTKLNDSLRFYCSPNWRPFFWGDEAFLLLGGFFLKISHCSVVYTCGTKNISKKNLSRGTNQPTHQPTHQPVRCLGCLQDFYNELWSTLPCRRMRRSSQRHVFGEVHVGALDFLGPNSSVFGWKKIHELTWWHVELILGMVTSMIRKSNFG